MRPSLGNAAGAAARELVLAAGHLADRGAGNDGDRFVVLMIMAWQRSAGRKVSIAAANSPRAQAPREQVAKVRLGRKLIHRCFVEPDQMLWSLRRRALQIAD